jgi:hypothetical protein
MGIARRAFWGSGLTRLTRAAPPRREETNNRKPPSSGAGRSLWTLLECRQKAPARCSCREASRRHGAADANVLTPAASVHGWVGVPRTTTALPEVRKPHQFRTRNDLDKAQQTRSKSNEKLSNSTKLTDIPPLITVWLQVRVLPGPPRISDA